MIATPPDPWLSLSLLLLFLCGFAYPEGLLKVLQQFF